MSIFYNAHHSPIGAFASLTLGAKGASGGLGIALTGPAAQSFFAGAETQPGQAEAFPFFAHHASALENFTQIVEETSGRLTLSPLPEESINRQTTLSTDTWTSGPLTLRLIQRTPKLPDPKFTSEKDLRSVLAPVVLIELTYDNSHGAEPRRVFLGQNFDCRTWGLRPINQVGMRGIAQGPSLGLFTSDLGWTSTGFNAEGCLSEGPGFNQGWMLGGCGMIQTVAMPGEVKTLRAVAVFHESGLITTGLPCRSYASKLWEDLEHAAAWSLDRFDELKDLALQDEKEFDLSRLSDSQRFQFIHAVRSYMGSTQLLEQDGQPIWVVNEGEYRMMNTFDLTVDHLFFELRQNPWVVANALDLFVDRYSYEDQCGLSFTHDMGVGNQWSPEGRSSYEKAGLKGCFSHMTHEQLVNWILCAGELNQVMPDWIEGHRELLPRLAESLRNRDRDGDGIMDVDSSRCEGGAEITTYDSLDESLGQARKSSYLGLKTAAAWAILGRLGIDDGLDRAKLGIQTLIDAVQADGTLPALLEEGCESRIIPSIEGLIFLRQEPELAAPLLPILKKHLEVVLAGPCRFDDGAWRLSSTSDNSWLSKIYLCQHIARTILGFDRDDLADEAHKNWLLRDENLFFAWSDQMISGSAKGSRYYPRGVTAALWLTE